MVQWLLLQPVETVGVSSGEAPAPVIGLLKSLPAILPTETAAAPCWAVQPDMGA